MNTASQYLLTIFKNSAFVVFASALFLTLLTPDMVSAQSGLVTCSGLDCSACNLAEMGNLIIIWLMGVLFVVFAVLMAVAGWGLVTSGGNVAAKQAAKDKFTNAVIGLIIVLAAWLLVDTLMRALLSTVGGTGPLPQGYIDGYGPWAQVQCQSQEETQVRRAMIVEDTALISAGLATTSTATAPSSNCGFDESALVSIPGEGSHRAVASVASTYVSMRSAAAAAGVSLRITSSYRPDSRQTELWDQCTRCQTQGTVARPCSRGGGGSRHSSGVALDISSSGGRGERCQIVNRCRAAGASFIMMYGGSSHVHCDWGGSGGEVNVSCP